MSDISPSQNTTETGSATPSQPQCGGGNAVDSEYNLGLHVGTLFVILTTSVLGVYFPIAAKKLPMLRIPEIVFFTVKHFGTGVIVATAFIHMLPSAFESLSDPCLSDFWTDTYTAAPGAIAMAAMFFIFFVEFVSTRYLARFDHAARAASVAAVSYSPRQTKTEAEDEVVQPTPTGHEGHHHFDPPPPDPTDLERSLLNNPSQTQALGVLILEAGIIFHSIFIGLTLAVSSGSEFISLFITIIFHQMFEGLGLGSRIATLPTSGKSWQPWALGFAYAVTTPLGIAIGMGVRTTYDPNSETALITSGVLDSISAGLLLYAALVELLAHEWINGELRVTHLRRTLYGAFILLLGAALMALLGRWA